MCVCNNTTSGHFDLLLFGLPPFLMNCMNSMRAQLDKIQVEDLPYLERDLNFAQKVSLSFLLFGDRHAHAAYILQKLITLVNAPDTEQLYSDLLRQYAQTNASNWRGHLVEALCIINARSALRKLGLQWQELRLHYLPQVKELTLHVHPLLKAMYICSEQLTVAECGRLVMDINKKIQQHAASTLDDPLRFYDFAYLEIFLLDWLTRRHLQLGDDNAVGSDVQLLIEYFKFNDRHLQATLLIQTVNSNASQLNPIEFETDSIKTLPAAPSTSSPQIAASVETSIYGFDQQRRPNALQISSERAGILLIINQQRFHRNVGEELLSLLPSVVLGPREGTNVDRQRLEDVFSALGYTVEAYNNVDHLEILEHIRSVCARTMMRESLIVCILSHGFDGAVYGADSIPLSIIDIQSVLCADENLYDKPKLLVIQACQQNEKNKKTRDVNATTSSPSQHANMLVAMSTVQGFVALRHSVQGSWFIQTLCDTVVKHAARAHVLDIFTIAIQKVSERRGDKNEKMMPFFTSSLLKNVYLPQPINRQDTATEEFILSDPTPSN